MWSPARNMWVGYWSAIVATTNAIMACRIGTSNDLNQLIVTIVAY